MKVVINVKLGELEAVVNRKIMVDDNIKLKDLCEYIIICMNGNKIPVYELDYNDILYYPYEIEENKVQKSMIGLTLKDFKLKKGTKFILEYNFDNFYYINIEIIDILDSVEYQDTDEFKVLSGNSYGLLDNISVFKLSWLLTQESYVKKIRYNKEESEYLTKEFDIVEVNNKILEYKKYKEEIAKPKRYVLNISLNGFDKEIKRKIVVNSNIMIDDFCRKIILAMNGDLSHGYGIKIGKEYLDDGYFKDIELYYLDLKEKQKFKLVYDWGDHWIFNISVSKIIESYGEKECEVLSGKGYGIIDDCGGVWGLERIFAGDEEDWGEYDINEFDIEECNKLVTK